MINRQVEEDGKYAVELHSLKFHSKFHVVPKLLIINRLARLVESKLLCARTIEFTFLSVTGNYT